MRSFIRSRKNNPQIFVIAHDKCKELVRSPPSNSLALFGDGIPFSSIIDAIWGKEASPRSGDQVTVLSGKSKVAGNPFPVVLSLRAYRIRTFNDIPLPHPLCLGMSYSPFLRWKDQTMYLRLSRVPKQLLMNQKTQRNEGTLGDFSEYSDSILEIE
jgi:hypothetical protein